MTQKVIKVGTSAAVVIPKEYLKKFGIKIGDNITVEADEKLQTFMIKATERVMTNKELVSWTRKFIHKYRSALEELADK